MSSPPTPTLPPSDRWLWNGGQVESRQLLCQSQCPQGSIEDCKIAKRENWVVDKLPCLEPRREKSHPLLSPYCPVVRRREGEGVLENKPVRSLPACLLCMCVYWARQGAGKLSSKGTAMCRLCQKIHTRLILKKVSLALGQGHQTDRDWCPQPFLHGCLLQTQYGASPSLLAPHNWGSVEEISRKPHVHIYYLPGGVGLEIEI